MTASPRLTPWPAAVALGASLVFSVSAFGLIIGALVTFFACSPGTDMGDAYTLVRVGPPMLGVSLLGLSCARRIWRLRRPNSAPKPRDPTPIQELIWVGLLVAAAVGWTWEFLSSPPWTTTPVDFYGGYDVVQLVPLKLFLRVTAGLLALRLLPTLAAVALSRRILEPARVAGIALLAAAIVTLLTFFDWAPLPLSPHGFVTLTLNLALILMLGTTALESRALSPQRHR